jgi:uncharacterized membrane protein YqaE (UPF0057 family)
LVEQQTALVSLNTDAIGKPVFAEPTSRSLALPTEKEKTKTVRARKDEVAPVTPLPVIENPQASSLVKSDKATPEKKAKKPSKPSVIGNILLLIIAIIFPPLAMLIKFGIDKKFWICLLLTILFYIPGLIYALYWIFFDGGDHIKMKS